MALPPPLPVIPYSQYNNAYPVIHYSQPPSACNGYGWHGNGYGWQVDPKAWHTPPMYPPLDQPAVAVEEPVVHVEKVTKQNAWVSFNWLLLFGAWVFIEFFSGLWGRDCLIYLRGFS